MVISPRGNENADLRVSSLISPNVACWNFDRLHQLFLPFECDRIASIPLSSRLPGDSICWDLERSGQYTVKSAYKTIFNDNWKGDEEATSVAAHTIWKKIWQIQALPRVKVFAWRACQNALPTRRNISYRIKDYDSECCICERDFESTLHALRDCKLARDVWRKSRFAHVALSRTSSIVDWWEGCLAEFDEFDAASIITLCWAIWGARNSWIMEGVAPVPEDVVSYAKKTSSEVGDALIKKNTKAAGMALPASWSPPSPSYYKVNVDAGFIDGLGSGLGVVVRDENGGVLVCGAAQSQDRWDTATAEAKAVMFGLQLAKDAGMDKLVVEGDCLQVIQALKNRSAGASSFSLIIEDI
ncbi:uncharacterized protein LOC110714373 [Chenopodium quinoa]|uniref:uncharacterized protein LOC110714373 n=1 Tax=Chenopodium quinoa TaxID=63459 RepID=UPI000B7746E1|nr:uncharacterized protein LOC110714373 [Chenopodium quinoa]